MRPRQRPRKQQQRQRQHPNFRSCLRKFFPIFAGLMFLLIIDRTRLFLEEHDNAHIDQTVLQLSITNNNNNGNDIAKWNDKSPHFRDACPANSYVMLVFPHVAKTGGRTLEATFMEPEVRHRHVSSGIRSLKYNLTLLNGHRNTLTLAKNLGCKSRLHLNDMRQCETRIKRPSGKGKVCARWIFMLREPSARVLSAFYTMTGRSATNTFKSFKPVSQWTAPHRHFSCPPGSLGARVLLNLTASFEDFSHLPKPARQACWSSVANQQTRYLAPDLPEDSTEQLRTAKIRLSTFAWFGLVERFQESMQLLSSSLQLELQLYTPVFNKNKYDKSLSEQARNVLLELNSNDIELYAYASRLFETRVRHMNEQQNNANTGKFVCDNNDIICWNKGEKNGVSWPLPTSHRNTETDNQISVLPQHPARVGLSGAELKEQVLCGPRRGCKWETTHNVQIDNNKDSKAPEENKFPVSNPPDVGENNVRKCWPCFLIIGARKGGTTSLYKYLAYHPGVKGIKLDAGAQTGELLFFRNLTMGTVGSNGARLHTRGKKRSALEYEYDAVKVRETYNRLFWNAMVAEDPSMSRYTGSTGTTSETSVDVSDQNIEHARDTNAGARISGKVEELRNHTYFPDVITGESSVDMAASCDTPKLMEDVCGSNVKLIFVARDPVKRLISQLRMRQRMGKDLAFASRRRSLFVLASSDGVRNLSSKKKINNNNDMINNNKKKNFINDDNNTNKNNNNNQKTNNNGDNNNNNSNNNNNNKSDSNANQSITIISNTTEKIRSSHRSSSSSSSSGSGQDRATNQNNNIRGLQRLLTSREGRGRGGQRKARVVTTPDEAIEVELKALSDSITEYTKTTDGIVETNRELVDQMILQLPCLFEHDFENMVWAGLYSMHLERWLRAGFPRENLLVISSDDLTNKPEDVVRQAMRFIGVDPDQVSDLADVVKVRFNSAPVGSSSSSSSSSSHFPDVENSDVEVSVAIRQRLARFYRPFNEDFSRRFGIDTSEWT